MATCGCGAELPGRRKVCDSCKKVPPADRPQRSGKPPAGEEAEAAETESAVPAGLRGRGRDLWKSLGEKQGTARGAIALEACRTADRLDELDSIIAGKGVLDLMRFRLRPDWWDDDGHHVTVEVKFASVLSTATGLQASMRGLLGQLDSTPKQGSGSGKSGATRTSTSGQPAAPRKTPLDQVGERRRQRGK